MKKIRRIVFSILLAMSLIGGLGSFCVFGEEETVERETMVVPQEVITQIDAEADAAGFAVYDLGSEVSYHTPLQQAAMLDDIDNILAYGEGLEEHSKPQGAVLRWTYTGNSAQTNPSDPVFFMIRIGEQEDLSDAREYVCELTPDENGIYSYAILNLYLMRTYYYTITAAGAGASSDVYSFTSADDVPRNLSVDGVTNVRDLGGWPLANGGYERQGMIYRGAKFNQDESTELLVTEKGIQTLVEDLGIRSEIDFRKVEDNENGGITESPLGESVRYYSRPWNANSIAKASDMIRDIIVLFADEENYPIYFHCSIGTDRTGFVAVLIHGLLGVSEEDIYRDYVFSDLGVIETAREAKNMRNRVEKNIKVCEGDTFQEQVRSYLESIGVTQEQMDQIVAIMTEPKGR